MSYKEISKYKYMKKDLEAEFMARFYSPSAMKTGFYVSPIDRGVKLTSIVNELWVNNIPEITTLISNIQKTSRQLFEHEVNLTVNQASEFREYLLIEEMQATNEYEGVKSTRQELKEALESRDDPKSNHRFKGLSMLYQRISKSKGVRITTPAEIREIYNELVANEIDSAAQIEADSMFRNERVTVGDHLATVHIGVEPDQIAAQLQVMLDFLNLEEERFPLLIKIILGHFMFEYIHPFYDGNGRVGRFLLADYLGLELDVFSSLLISSSVVSNRKTYEKSFITTSNKDNYGEGTFFVLELLELLFEAQTSVLYELEVKRSLYRQMTQVIKRKAMDAFTRKVFWMYFDHAVYGSQFKPLTRKEIEQHFEVGEWSTYKQRKAEAYLEEIGYLLKVGEKPVKYQLDLDYIKDALEQNSVDDHFID